jgi:large subunit ribosomal protein L13
MKLTASAKKSEIRQEWHLVDAKGLVLGRLAGYLATILMGKHKATYTPNVDTGDFVVVVNAGEVRLTGNKENTKEYQSYSGYPGGLKKTSYKRMKEKKPEFILTEAVRRMLPKNKLGRAMLAKLKVYADSEHPHEAQNPVPLNVTTSGGIYVGTERKSGSKK